jgi:ribosomal protein S6
MEERRTNSYEITFSTKVESTSAIRAAVMAVHGEVIEERPFEKIRLEFPVRKESFAFLGVVRASLPSEAVAPLGHALSLSPEILRHLITALPPVPPENRETERPRAPEYRRPPTPRAATLKEPPILTNEALERKIEEILQ